MPGSALVVPTYTKNHTQNIMYIYKRQKLRHVDILIDACVHNNNKTVVEGGYIGGEKIVRA